MPAMLPRWQCTQSDKGQEDLQRHVGLATPPYTMMGMPSQPAMQAMHERCEDLQHASKMDQSSSEMPLRAARRAEVSQAHALHDGIVSLQKTSWHGQMC